MGDAEVVGGFVAEGGEMGGAFVAVEGDGECGGDGQGGVVGQGRGGFGVGGGGEGKEAEGMVAWWVVGIGVDSDGREWGGDFGLEVKEDGVVVVGEEGEWVRDEPAQDWDGGEGFGERERDVE